MTSNMIGQERSTAVWQLLGVVYLFTVFPIVLVIGLVGGVIYMGADVLLKLSTNRDISSYGETKTTKFSQRLFEWPLGQLRWIATGDGKFPWLP